MSADGSAREPLFVLSSGRIDHGDNPRAVYLSPLTGDLTIGPRVDRGQPPNPFTVSPFDHWRVTDASIVDDDKDGSDELFLALFENIGRLLVIDPSEERAVWALESHNRNFISSVDLNGDGFADLLSSVGAFDIVNDALIWEPQPAVANETVEDAAGGDLNGDGVGEIVTIEGGAVVVYSRSTNEEDFTRSQIPHIISEATSWISDLLVSDTDGDGGAEILLLDYVLSNMQRFGSSLELLNSFNIPHEQVHDQVDRMFTLPGGGDRAQVLVSYVRENRGQASRIIAFDAATGREIWESPWLFGRVLPKSVHYFEHSGEPRLAIGTSEAMYVTQ